MTSDPALRRALEAWQTLLAAELPAAKAWTLGQAIAEGRLGRSELLAHRELAPGEAQRAAGADFRALDESLAQGIFLITPDRYPEPLRRLQFPPPAVFAWGDWACAGARTVAIVGTRGASTYGKAVAQKFAEAFARAGVTVVSGGALGIDAAAHKGALEAGGRTLAVLAGGVDKVYPAVHGALFRQIRERGCLVSQFAVGARPNPYKFIVRNGLIAGLSEAVVIVEAPLRSGALATAHAAAELGRDVFVVPANIDHLGFSGSHALIRDGATLVDHPDQVLESIGIEAVAPEVRPAPASPIAQLILGALTVEPASPEVISDRTGLDASVVLSELTMLELEGAVLRDRGGFAVVP